MLYQLKKCYWEKTHSKVLVINNKKSTSGNRLFNVDWGQSHTLKSNQINQHQSKTCKTNTNICSKHNVIKIGIRSNSKTVDLMKWQTINDNMNQNGTKTTIQFQWMFDWLVHVRWLILCSLFNCLSRFIRLCWHHVYHSNVFRIVNFPHSQNTFICL